MPQIKKGEGSYCKAVDRSLKMLSVQQQKVNFNELET